jgi:hypothetical protein
VAVVGLLDGLGGGAHEPRLDAELPQAQALVGVEGDLRAADERELLAAGVAKQELANPRYVKLVELKGGDTLRFLFEMPRGMKFKLMFGRAMLVVLVGGCSLFKQTPKEKAQSIEPLLSAAGFKMKLADTPEKLAHLLTMSGLEVENCTPVAPPFSGVVVGEIEQVRMQLDTAVTLLRSFMDATGMPIAEARTLLAKFGLVGAHVERPTTSLSPGERARAALALMMANGANLLVLDEPTNHLDLPAIEQLEQALDTFAGTVILVTHDRELLDRVRLTRTVQLEAGAIV